MALPTNKEKVIEAFEIFDKSIYFEFLEPPSNLNATVLMRATYRNTHPLTKLGKNHPQAPPYHLHFSQSESFVVLSGRIGTTLGFECKDHIWTRANTIDTGKAHEIKPWVPHTFWPVPPQHPASTPGEDKASQEDAVLLVWAHPQVSGNLVDGGADMDYIFFRALIMMASDMYDGKLAKNFGMGMVGALGAILSLQEASDSAPVAVSGPMWLSEVRYWVPWKLQQVVAWLWRASGGRRDGLIQHYVPEKVWLMLQEKKDS